MMSFGVHLRAYQNNRKNTQKVLKVSKLLNRRVPKSVEVTEVEGAEDGIWHSIIPL